MTQTPEISVVIPAHNAAATIGVQLAALAEQQTNHPFEVIVVDNRSSDDTARIVAGFHDRLPGLRIADARAGEGAAYARNTGVQEATGELLLFCDADDEVHPGWVGAMGAALQDADIVGGAIEVAKFNPPEVQSGYPNLAPQLQVGRHQLPFATGCSMGIRRAVFERLGGFDESSSPAEDQDLSLRAQFAGCRLVFAPDAIVHYRLRSGIRAVARQHYHYGLSDARLFSRFPDVGPPLTVYGEARMVLGTLRRAPQFLDPMKRVRWMRKLSLHSGRLVGMRRMDRQGR